MAGYASFFKTDRLPAFRTGLPKQAFLMFVAFLIILILQVSVFKDSTYSIGYGEN